MLIKVILLLAIAMVVALWMRTPGGARHLALRRMSIALFAVLAVLSILFPDLEAMINELKQHLGKFVWQHQLAVLVAVELASLGQVLDGARDRRQERC